MRNKNLWKAILSFVESNEEPFNWTHIRDHLLKKTGFWVDIYIIRRILKEKMGFSYKRYSSRPLKHNYYIWKLKKILFSVKIWKMFDESSILINIDEATFSNKTKTNYSWSKRGCSSNCSSIIFRGSVSIVSAILSNVVSITGIRAGTINSKAFIEYINHLLRIWGRL